MHEKLRLLLSFMCVATHVLLFLCCFSVLAERRKPWQVFALHLPVYLLVVPFFPSFFHSHLERTAAADAVASECVTCGAS